MKYFKVYELVSKEIYDKMGDDALTLFNHKILTALDDLREYMQAPCTCNNWHEGGQFQHRGYRTPEEASALGAPNSEHAKGEAFDVDFKGWTADMVRRKILTDMDNPLLANITRIEAGVSWLHFDCKELVAPQKRIYFFVA